MLNAENLTATDSCLARWKEQNNIVYRKLQGEKQDLDFDVASY